MSSALWSSDSTMKYCVYEVYHYGMYLCADEGTRYVCLASYIHSCGAFVQHILCASHYLGVFVCQ